jgi:DNA-binding HxlR family transcriptional regulator
MNIAWYNREFNMYQLKGSKLIIYNALNQMLQDPDTPPSVFALSTVTRYHPNTVARALRELNERGIIHYHQENPGERAEYRILTPPEELGLPAGGA